MNLAMEMLRNRAQQLYDSIAGESNIEFLIDPVEEPATQTATSSVVASCKITYGTESTRRMSDCLMRSNNIPAINNGFDHLKWLFEQQSKAKVKVWIYNISHQRYELGNGMIKKLIIPACPDDEEYTVVTSIPAVYIYPKDNVDTNSVDYFIFDGRRVAMDLIDPSNFSIDQDADYDWARHSASVGNNYSTRGVFFSTHNPPLKRELKAAHKRLKAYYTDMLERANIVRLTAAPPAIGVTTNELIAAQQYVEDSNGNK